MSIFLSFIFYYSLIIVVSFLAFLSQKEYILIGMDSIVNSVKYGFLLISFLIIWLVMGLRFNLTSDYFNYINIYKDIKGLGLIWALTTLRTEPLFSVLNWFVIQFFNSEVFIFLSSSFIVLLICFVVILKNKEFLNVGLSLFIFLTIYYFPMFTYIRLSIAVSFVFLSYKYLISKEFSKYFCCIIIAIGFHYTAIIMFPIYFLININDVFRNYKYVFFVIFVFLFLITFPLIGKIFLFGTKFENYFFGSRFGNFIGGLKHIIKNLPLILSVVYFRKRLIDKNVKNRVYIEVFFIGCILLLFTFWIGILDRLLIYFFISQVLILPQIFTILRKEEIPLFIYSFFVYYFLRVSYTLLSSNQLLPYKSVIGI